MWLVNVSQIYLIGLVAMLLFAIWFFINRHRSQYFLSAFIVAAVTLLTYEVLLDGTLVGMSESGDVIYYTRWLFYALSCSVLMATIAKFIKSPEKNLPAIIMMNVLVMISGAVAAVVDGPMKWVIFIFGGFFYVWQLMLLFEKVKDDEKSAIIKRYILIGWTAFPIVFMLAPEGLGLIDNILAAALYLLLDVYAKGMFYIEIAAPDIRKKKLKKK